MAYYNPQWKLEIENPLAQVIAQGTKDRIAVWCLVKGISFCEPVRFNTHVQPVESRAMWDCLQGKAVPGYRDPYSANIYSARRQTEAAEFAETVKAMMGIKS